MLDDIDASDRFYVEHMEEASAMLRECIERARAGLPTEAPYRAKPIRVPVTATMWDDTDVAILRDMRSRGRSAGQIAKALGRSRGAVGAAVRRYLGDGK